MTNKASNTGRYITLSQLKELVELRSLENLEVRRSELGVFLEARGREQLMLMYTKSALGRKTGRIAMWLDRLRFR
jgi:hypothetical protein